MYPLLALAVMPLLWVRVAYHVAGIVHGSDPVDAVVAVKVRDAAATSLSVFFDEEAGPWQAFLSMAWVEEVVIVGVIVGVGWLFVKTLSKKVDVEMGCVCGKCTCRKGDNAKDDKRGSGKKSVIEEEVEEDEETLIDR